MAISLSKTYQPTDVQNRIDKFWADTDAFHAQPTDPGDSYCVVIPPPNVTAALHLGHALNNTLQDVLVRWRRMAGDNAVWIPGTDHAGIATQTVVEKRVLAEEGKKRTDFQRDEFIAIVQQWKDEYEERITDQLKAMGCSCDWERQAFTMDEPRTAAVREAFFHLFEQNLIYRGKRLVNWDPETGTALADDEVINEEIDGFFWYMRYPLVTPIQINGKIIKYLTIATTRPETMLGDTAVAINPRDPHAAALKGAFVRLPIVGRVIPIIEDDYVVLPDPNSDDPKAQYATGFLKVTPAHDPNDWLIGQRHDLPIINVMAPDGTISDQYGWSKDDIGDADFLLSMDRYEAREAIVEWFRENNLLEEVKAYTHVVGHSYRSHVAIEPYLSDQWYVKVTDDRLAGASLRAMAIDQRSESTGCVWKATDTFDGGNNGDWEGGLRFTPQRYAKTFQSWHENLKDWCISRQLWWGHRIPIWTKDLKLPKDIQPTPVDTGPDAQICAALDKAVGGVWNEVIVNAGQYHLNTAPHPEKEGWIRAYICIRHESAAIEKIIEDAGWQRDPDVLDTWFSSALWPLSTLGWPDDDAPELQAWNPTSTLSTAREIITLWVSRMVMFNVYFHGCLPFSDVFIHAMVQDGEGRKMSKSLGNGVDPLDIIATHGTDAMRFTLTQMTTQTQDVRMPVEFDEKTGRNTSPKFDIGSKFCNKIWNAARFALANLDGEYTATPADLSLVDKWIISRLARTTKTVNHALANFQFNVYAQCLYDFFWRDFCDWYLEVIKPVIKSNNSAGAAARQTLAACLDSVLRMLHPVVPYITEEIFHQINSIVSERSMPDIQLNTSDMCVRAGWPVISESLIDDTAEAKFDHLRSIVAAIRDMRAAFDISPRQTVACSIKADVADAAILNRERELIQTMGNVDLTAIAPDVTKDDNGASTTLGTIEVCLSEVMDTDAERNRLNKQLVDLEKDHKALLGRLNNKGYIDKAPPQLVEQTRQQLATVEMKLKVVREKLV